MKENLNIYIDKETILAVKDFCAERNMSVSAYVQMVVDSDINSGFDCINNSNDNGLVLSYDNEILTANEARLMLKNHPCFKFMYME